jgi:hypothetical protein
MIMNGEDRSDANRHLRLSANEYMNALDFFPQDDELYSSKQTYCLPGFVGGLTIFALN